MLTRLWLVATACALVLASCGGVSDEALTTLAPTQATDFVVVEVSTTTTIPATTAAPFNPTDPSLPASATIPPATTAAPVNDGTYTIVEGDSMLSIAAKFGLTVDELIAINGWTDGTSHLLLPGTTIKVSKSASTATTAAPPTTSGGGNSGSGCTYVIKAGETPWSVAKKFGISVDALTAANSASVMNSFLPGATLQIPAGGSC